VITDEFALFIPKEEGKYFSIGTQLFQGGIILYAADEAGNTIDLEAKPPVNFYRDAEQVEHAIAKGEINRPFMAVNGEVIWQWPQPRIRP
jgi:hypothetical protein